MTRAAAPARSTDAHPNPPGLPGAGLAAPVRAARAALLALAVPMLAAAVEAQAAAPAATAAATPAATAAATPAATAAADSPAPAASAGSGRPPASGDAAAESPWRFEVGGRIQLDHDRFDGLYSDDGERVAASYVRRASIEFKLYAFEHWKFGLELAPLADGAEVLDTLLVAWSGWPGVEVSAGRFKPDFSLEQATSSSWVTGIERSAIWDLAPDAAERSDSWGVELRTGGAHYHASVGLFAKPGGAQQSLRVAWAPLLQRDRVLHLGASYAHGAVGSGSGRIRTRLAVRGVSEDDRGNRVTLAKRQPGGFDDDHAAVLEFAYLHGPFSVQAELLQRRLVAAASMPPRSAFGQYLQLAWMLTGEMRRYRIDGARWRAPQPARPIGAWELFWRHDRLRVDGAPGLVGDARSSTRARVDVVGINWYATRDLRVSLNYLWGHADQIANDVGDSSGRALSLRLQFVF